MTQSTNIGVDLYFALSLLAKEPLLPTLDRSAQPLTLLKSKRIQGAVLLIALKIAIYNVVELLSPIFLA